MRIQTGRGTIPLITLVGICLSPALNALPGLAVSPSIRETFRYFSSFYGTGYSDAFLFAIVIDNSIYYIVG